MPEAAPRRRAGRGRLSTRRKLRLVAEILLTYARVRWLLRQRELPAVVAQLRAEPRRAPGGALRNTSARTCSYAVTRTLRLLPTDSRCLVSSLVLLALLARHGAAAQLVIGVIPGPQFAAHAWLEYRGEALLKPGRAGAGRLVEL